jgi:hypothetical protein
MERPDEIDKFLFISILSFPCKRESRLVPVKTGNQFLKAMDSPHQVRGKLCFFLPTAGRKE